MPASISPTTSPPPLPPPRRGRLRRRSPRLRVRGDDGMTTAEYAVGTVAACGFAALLYEVVTSDSVQNLVAGVITQALKTVV